MGTLLLMSSVLFAQKESVLAFYRTNMNVVNPAYAGVDNLSTVTTNFRKQWTGIEDAPETQSVSASTSLGGNLGIGLSVINDKTFIEKKYIRPDLRENYELLIKYYKQKEDTKMQLLYINRLLEVDSVLNHNYKYLSQKIFKEYDAKKLIKAKTELEHSMRWKNKVAYATSVFLLISIVIIIRKQRKKSKYYKQKFEELMSASNTNKTNISKPLDVDLEINPEIVETVLKNLEKFEKSKK